MEPIREFQGKYRWLSNFWPAPIFHQRTRYPTVEHFYQCMKTENTAQRENIRTASTPAEAKRLGRYLTMRPHWHAKKDHYMTIGIHLKFAPDSTFAEWLLDTIDAPLVEGNRWHDIYWGVCYCPRCNGAGQNRLGQLLMARRQQLRTKLPEPAWIEHHR